MPTNINSDQIFIKDLVIMMSAGIYDHEKENQQRVIFNVTLEVDSNCSASLNSIIDVTSYEEIANAIEAISGSQHFDLLEELAEKISAHCLSLPKVRSIDLSIEKPDIIQNTKSVGIRVVRTQLN
ncbi:MAG: dihydroneopterin aldolase [Alphaproteobacteria bacterium]